VCSGDPPLKPTNPSKTLCRLFINSLTSDATFQCSAWFVAPSTVKRMGFWYMVTAGEDPGAKQLCRTDIVMLCCYMVLCCSEVHGHCR
jgi:hypothetical protein